MTRTQDAGGGTTSVYVKPPPARAALTVGLLGLVLLAIGPLAQADTPQRTGWWFDAGLGGGTANARADGVVDGGGGVWIDVLLGRRLNDRWLMGLELGGLGLHPSGGNDACGCNNSIYGESFTHTMLAVRYLPKVEHGWVFGLSAGPAFYYNQSLELLTGNYDSGNGWAADAAVGYDWPYGQNKAHVEAILNVEQGHISYNAPLSGQFSYSEVAASVHLSWF